MHLRESSPLSGFASLLGGTILTFLFLTVAVSEVGWFIGIPVHPLALLASYVGACFAAMLGTRIYFSGNLRTAAAVVLLFSLLLLGAAAASAAFYDVSFDGQAYQQEGVYQLANGWNPVFTRHIYPIYDEQNVKLNHFPKGPWIIAAAVYRLTGHIEIGKLTNLLLLFAAFFIALSVFAGLKKRSMVGDVTMAALVAANPVALCQLFTFYVDGQMASLFSCLVAFCFLAIVDFNPWVNMLLFETAVLIILVKFTGLVYVVMIFSGFLIMMIWKRSLLQKQPLYTIVLALVLGTLLFGMNPYVYNTLENRHPFYPFWGEGEGPKIVIAAATPPTFLHSNRIKNVLVSLFSKSLEWPPQSTLKIPFSVHREWMEFENEDVSIGGFGPLFSGALVVSIALLALGLLQGNSVYRTIAVLILMVFASALPVEACWWARYAPQLWLIPLLSVAPMWGNVQRRILRYMSLTILLILAVNASGIAYINLRANINATRETTEQLNYLRSYAPFKIAFGYFRSNRIRFHEAGIIFVEDEKNLTCDPDIEDNGDFCIQR